MEAYILEKHVLPVKVKKRPSGWSTEVKTEMPRSRQCSDEETMMGA